jgi:signal peptidase I
MDVARSAPVGATASAAAGPHAARPPIGRELALLVGVALALTLLLRLFVVQAFYIPSGSMEPTLAIGDRVLVNKVTDDISRGDVVVFDGRGSFTPAETVGEQGVLLRASRAVGGFLGVAPSDRDYVKRVIGVAGDRVVCCDAGRLSVNGVPLAEPYVMPGDTASEQPFDVLVPAGRLWLMGDHRSDSADSRAHLGDPGGGMVRVDRVVGEVALRFWPLPEAGPLPVTASR